jgi:hypothetical protein
MVSDKQGKTRPNSSKITKNHFLKGRYKRRTDANKRNSGGKGKKKSRRPKDASRGIEE